MCASHDDVIASGARYIAANCDRGHLALGPSHYYKKRQVCKRTVGGSELDEYDDFQQIPLDYGPLLADGIAAVSSVERVGLRYLSTHDNWRSRSNRDFGEGNAKAVHNVIKKCALLVRHWG